MTAGAFLIKRIFGAQASEIYFRTVLPMNGIGNLLIFLLMYPKFKKDLEIRRECGITQERGKVPLRLVDAVYLIFTGAALAIAANFSLSFFAEILKMNEYTDSMDLITKGIGVFWIILYVGIIGPMTEEIIFRGFLFLRIRDHMSLVRSAVLSGLIFGIYHGNLAQFVYAAILGIIFALFVEWTGSIWSSIFLHIGANMISILLSEYGDVVLSVVPALEILLFLILFLLILFNGVAYYRSFGTGRKRRI